MRNTIPADTATPASAATLPDSAHQPCHHRFAQAGHPHYCTYIHPELVSTLYPASTPDEQLLLSYLAGLVLWWRLLERELAALSRLLTASTSLALTQYQVARKRIQRCLALDEAIAEASQIIQCELVERAPVLEVTFAFDADFRQLPAYNQVLALTARLPEQATSLEVDASVAEESERAALRLTFTADLNAHCQYVSGMLRTLYRLVQVIRQQPPAKRVPLLEAIPANRLLAAAEDTLRRHHPQVLADPDQTDPLVFVVANQLFEIWFPAVITALREATALLQPPYPRLLAATMLVQRSAALVRLWQRMIHAPQTMSAPDYIAFRAQLAGGSGAESEHFRQVEIAAGLRHPQYRQSLESLHLLTPQLEALWQQPSLNDALLELLAKRGIITPDAPAACQAEQLAAIWRPTGTPQPHVDVVALCQAALDLDEQFWLWRTHHLAMVRSMIGGKPSIGMGWTVNHDLSAASPDAAPVGGLPYLEGTTRYQLFPLLHQAVEHLQEQWQEVAPVTAGRA